MVSMFWPRQESYLLYKEEVEKDFLLLAVVFLIPNANFMPTLPIYSRLSAFLFSSPLLQRRSHKCPFSMSRQILVFASLCL